MHLAAFSMQQFCYCLCPLSRSVREFKHHVEYVEYCVFGVFTGRCFIDLLHLVCCAVPLSCLILAFVWLFFSSFNVILSLHDGPGCLSRLALISHLCVCYIGVFSFKLLSWTQWCLCLHRTVWLACPDCCWCLWKFSMCISTSFLVLYVFPKSSYIVVGKSSTVLWLASACLPGPRTPLHRPYMGAWCWVRATIFCFLPPTSLMRILVFAFGLCVFQLTLLWTGIGDDS